MYLIIFQNVTYFKLFFYIMVMGKINPSPLKTNTI